MGNATEGTQLPPHQQRVVSELYELKEKTEKLQSFFSTEIYGSMAGEDKQLLICQHGTMVAYVGILELRVARF